MNIHGKFLVPALVSMLLAACGSGISGTYEGEMGSITFSSSKADANLLGSTREMDYSTDGNKVVLQSNEGNLVLTRKPDGSLDTPWGNMKKK